MAQRRCSTIGISYLAIAREGTLACEPGMERLILDKEAKALESVFFKRVIAQMAPMSAQEQRDYYQACLKQGNSEGIHYAAQSYAASGVGPRHDVMLSAATIHAVYDANVLHREVSDESAVAFSLASAMSKTREGIITGLRSEAGIKAEAMEKNKDPLIKEALKRAKKIQTKFPYWGVRNYNNPAMQTINQRFYTLDEMRDAGIHFSFDPPKEQADN